MTMISALWSAFNGRGGFRTRASCEMGRIAIAGVGRGVLRHNSRIQQDKAAQS
jgi:hypothetical protein